MIRGKKILSILLVGVLCFGSVLTAHANEIEDAKKKAAELEQQKQAAEAQKSSLAAELNVIISDMQDTQEKLADKHAQIEEAEIELVNAKVDENNQYESMKKRIKYMYENGNSEFIAMLLQAESITDFLNKAEYVTQISEYDRNMLVRFQETVKEVEEKEEMLRVEYAELEVIQNDLINQQNSVEALLQSKNVEISNLKSEIGANAALLQELIKKAEAEAAAQKAAEEAAAQAAALAAAQAAQSAGSAGSTGGSSSSSGSSGGGYVPAGPPVVSGSGYFTHPCPGMSYQSSYFGEIRSFEVGGHKGHDYAAATGTPTYAAAAGTVIIANYSSSAGNWVVINHGNGLVTKYMHHSALTVSAGQVVAKGQQIGLVGTTGQSTGPHLHFQVELNGVAVSPDSYM